MSENVSTKAGVFESGDKDAEDVLYQGGRLISCRNPQLEEYTVAEGTEVICDRAFMNVRGLRSIKLPGSIKAIGESAFSGCKALSDIDIPEGVGEIRQSTFRDCDALIALELPASVTKIEKFAFGRGLTTLVVNATEMNIDKYAFMNARDFKMLIVPKGCGDYYRALLAEIRLKTEVEETEDNSIPKELNGNMEEEKCISIPNEFVAVKKFKNGETGRVHGYPVFIKEGVCYDWEDNVENVSSFDELKYYTETEGYDNEYYIDSSISDLDNLAKWILNGWTDMVFEEGYYVVNNEFIVEFWTPDGIFFSKEVYIK